MQQRRPAIVAPELETAPFFRARRGAKRRSAHCSGALDRSCVSLSAISRFRAS